MRDPLAALPAEIGTELLVALRSAVDLEIPELFTDVVAWAQTVLLFRNVERSSLACALDALAAKLPHYVPLAALETARVVLAAGRLELDILDLIETPAIDETTQGGGIARRYLTHVLDGDERRATREVLLALARGMSTPAIHDDVLVPILHETGRLWQRNEISVAQEHLVTAAVERTMAQLMDLLPMQSDGDFSVATACVGFSQHQVAARMVADAFTLCGWHASYLGGMVPIPDLLDYADHVSVDVLALSATLGRDVAPVRQLIAELETRPVAPLVIVGGRGFSLHPSLWRKVGADGCAHSPMMAVALANDLLAHHNAL